MKCLLLDGAIPFPCLKVVPVTVCAWCVAKNDPCICSISTLSFVDIRANFSVKTCEVFLCFESYNYFPSPTMTSFFLVKDQLL